MPTIYKVTGKLTDNRTVALDEPLPLAQSTVKLVIEPFSPVAQLPYREVMAAIHTRQLARGHKAPTREEVDTLLKAERENWEE